MDLDRTEKRIFRAAGFLAALYLIGFIAFWVGVIVLIWKLAF